ncbi:MAG: hypothetical protein MUE40_11385, partial [Anaerolineae bacterium]|nr:hypothetical protein [Anaerolineae bacterium]
MNARSFLTDELRRLNDTIAHLEVSLQRYTPADPRRAGNAALLAMQQREHTLLTELLACADDGDVLDCCHERLRRVEAEHLQLTL